ncbi:MAG: glutathione S-transferase N-terminal domain-containing protein [Nannocystaceae bacterium]
MHTLFAFPYACSQAVHVTLRQHQVPFEIAWVERGYARKIAGDGFAAVNPKRKVPALRLPDGELLTEAIAVLHHLDEAHARGRSAAEGRRSLEWLSFVATELHQQILGPLFDPDTPAAALPDLRDRVLPPVIEHLEATYSRRPTLLGGERPTGADAYALWAVLLLRLRWPEAVARPGLKALRERMLGEPWVQEALQVELAQRNAEAARAG